MFDTWFIEGDNNRYVTDARLCGNKRCMHQEYCPLAAAITFYPDAKVVFLAHWLDAPAAAFMTLE